MAAKDSRKLHSNVRIIGFTGKKCGGCGWVVVLYLQRLMSADDRRLICGWIGYCGVYRSLGAMLALLGLPVLSKVDYFIPLKADYNTLALTVIPLRC